MQPQLVELLATQPLLIRRDLPLQLARSIDHALTRGELRQVMPGIYCAASTDPIAWRIAALAACAYLEDAVVTGDVAAALSFAPDRPVRRVEAAHRNPVRARGPVFWHRGSIPPEWICEAGALRITHPAWTAVDICGRGDSAILDTALRCGVGLENLWRAFADMPARKGNPIRHQLLTESRDEPWSAAERLAHQILRKAGISGWRTNVPIGDYVADIAWPHERVILEVDGYEFHSGPAQFQSDRLRDQTLIAQGWVVIRVTWAQLTGDLDGFLRRLRGALRLRRGQVAA